MKVDLCDRCFPHKNKEAMLSKAEQTQELDVGARFASRFKADLCSSCVEELKEWLKTPPKVSAPAP